MIAAEIASALGAAQRCGQWWRCRCPVHGSRGATLAIRDAERGPLVKCFAGCAPREVLATLKQRGMIDTAGIGNGNSRHAAGPSDDAARIAAAKRIWDRASYAGGTPVAAYLTERGINLPVSLALRWAPTLRRADGGNGPAMVAIVEHVGRGFIGIHRTWLSSDAGDARHWIRLDRASLGPIRGGAVRLAQAGGLLMVGEGIETCLSAMQATGLPAWAAISTSGLVGLALPALPLAATVLLLADNDITGAGERAARTAADRWLREGRRVQIAMPPAAGTDFNDVLLGRTHANEVRDVAA